MGSKTKFLKCMLKLFQSWIFIWFKRLFNSFWVIPSIEYLFNIRYVNVGPHLYLLFISQNVKDIISSISILWLYARFEHTNYLWIVENTQITFFKQNVFTFGEGNCYACMKWVVVRRDLLNSKNKNTIWNSSNSMQIDEEFWSRNE